MLFFYFVDAYACDATNARANAHMNIKIDASATRAIASDNVNANNSDSANATVLRIPYLWPDKLSSGSGYNFGYQYFAFHISGR